jgi:general secretion pathway protein G
MPIVLRPHRAARPAPSPAFSLVELIIAVVVLSLLAGVLTPMFGRSIDEARRATAVAACRQICNALAAYRDDHGSYPPGLQGDPTYSYANGTAYGYGAEVLNTWLCDGPKKYLNEPIGRDPWGSAFNYHVFTRSDPYMDVVVFSNGPDRVCDSWDGTLWNRARFNGDDLGAFFDLSK